LNKCGVTLDENGEMDMTNVAEENTKNWLIKNSELVKLTLMQDDLEFEYP